MWICSKLGFFSVVRKPDGLFHIRARVRKDLENLVAQLGKTHRPIIHDTHETDPHADYAFRIVCDQTKWAAISMILVCSVDYANFKGVIGSTPDQRERLGIYSAFHHDMERFQNGESSEDPPPDPWEDYHPERLGPRD